MSAQFGIRIALGAKPQQIWSEIAASSGQLAFIGVIIGSVVAFLASKLIDTLLFGVERFDVVTYSYAAMILLAAVVLACAGRRATSIDPARALREQ